MRSRSDGPAWPDRRWWEAQADRLGLRRAGGELIGGCPACAAGEDRFYVTPDGGAYCRRCCPDGNDPDAVRRLFDAAGWERPGPARVSRETARNRRTPDAAPRGPDAARRKAARREAGALWLRAAPLSLEDVNPGAEYLRGRLRVVDGPGGWLKLELPASIRWLAPWPPEVPKPPAAPAGCLLFRWQTRAGAGGGVSAMAVAPDGRRIEWRGGKAGVKARMIGARAGLLHVVRPAAGGRWHIAEGELDALALLAWPAQIVAPVDGIAAAGGAGRLLDAARSAGGPVTLWPDGDRAGRDAARKARLGLIAAGQSGAAVSYQATPDSDPLDATIALYRALAGAA